MRGLFQYTAAAMLVASPAYSQVVKFAKVSLTSATLTIDMHNPMELDGMPSQSPISGAPYSARRIFEPDQTRGPAANTTQETLLARDSMGRVRTDRPPATAAQMPGFKLVTIDDPIGGYRYLLDTVNHVAHRMALPEDRPMPVPVSPQPPARRPALTMQPGPGIDSTVESLGVKLVNGVRVEGRRTTTNYGPGSETAREHPAVSVQETWMAPSLGILVSSKMRDVNGSERSTTLVDLVAAEPDPALFRVPSDYQVQDETGEFTIVIRR